MIGEREIVEARKARVKYIDDGAIGEVFVRFNNIRRYVGGGGKKEIVYYSFLEKIRGNEIGHFPGEILGIF